MFVVYIKDLVVEAKHGVHQREKEQAQRFNFNVEVTIDGQADASDDMADTLNYTELKSIITDTALNHSFNLIERLARVVADQILTDTRVQKVTIAIDKPEVFKSGVPGVRLEATFKGND
jgi:dihydroneopterin aldolase